jgi:hypothetical protein
VTKNKTPAKVRDKGSAKAVDPARDRAAVVVKAVEAWEAEARDGPKTAWVPDRNPEPPASALNADKLPPISPVSRVWTPNAPPAAPPWPASINACAETGFQIPTAKAFLKTSQGVQIFSRPQQGSALAGLYKHVYEANQCK